MYTIFSGVMKNPPIEYDTSHCPCDIIQNILSRLPLKSLLRFKAVSKSWKAIIDDPGFAKIHSKQSIISNSQSFCAVARSRDKTYELIKFQGEEPYVQSVVQFPSTEFDVVNFLCCCDGILLFQCSYRKTNKMYLLFNPFTRNYSTISFPLDDGDNHDPVSHRLCFDKYEDDYKVIVVSGDGKYSVYSIKNHTWAERRSEFRGFLYQGTCADGMVYWVLVTLFEDSSCCTAIIYFDPEDNLLKKLNKPADLEPENINFYLTNFSGNLCLYTTIDFETVKIWLLKESGSRKCWMKLTTVRNDRSQARLGNYIPWILFHMEPICLTSKNELVFYDAWSLRCYAYRPESDTQKILETKEFPAVHEIIVHSCLESLNFPAMN